jgi:hypothetical protein
VEFDGKKIVDYEKINHAPNMRHINHGLRRSNEVLSQDV